MKRRLRSTLIGLFFALIVAHTSAAALLTFERLSASSERGWRAIERDGRIVVFTVDPSSPAAALRPGDEIVAIDGRPVGDSFAVSSRFRSVSPGATYTLTVRRDGRVEDLALATEPFSPGAVALQVADQFAVPLIFLAASVAVFLLRLRD